MKKWAFLSHTDFLQGFYVGIGIILAQNAFLSTRPSKCIKDDPRML